MSVYDTTAENATEPAAESHPTTTRDDARTLADVAAELRPKADFVGNGLGPDGHETVLFYFGVAGDGSEDDYTVVSESSRLPESVEIRDVAIVVGYQLPDALDEYASALRVTIREATTEDEEEADR